MSTCQASLDLGFRRCPRLMVCQWAKQSSARDRWMRHADVPASRWNVIVDFSKSKQFLPPGRFHWPSMTASGLAEICKRKPKPLMGLTELSYQVWEKCHHLSLMPFARCFRLQKLQVHCLNILFAGKLWAWLRLPPLAHLLIFDRSI